MNVDIPSNYGKFALRVNLESKQPTELVLQVRDKNKPNTYYYKRKVKVNGKRTVDLKFPSSPEYMVMKLYNPHNGNLPYGKDPTFSSNGGKAEKLRTCDVWWDDMTKSFYKFAVEFCENAGTLSAGNRKPHIYRSDDGKFTIDYYNRIVDKKTGKVLKTPARVGHTSGIIEVGKYHFEKYTVPMRLIILLHEFSHKYKNPQIGRDISYETGADINALYIYLGMGWSEVEAHRAFLTVFSDAKSKGNHKRYKIIKDFIDKYSKGLIEKCNVGNV